MRVFEGVGGNRNGMRSPEQEKGALASRQQPPATTWHRDLINPVLLSQVSAAPGAGLFVGTSACQAPGL